MTSLLSYLDIIIKRWEQEDIPIRPGVTFNAITAFEDRNRVTLPNDMREFYLAVDGMGEHYDNDFFFRFWPLSQVQPIDTYRPELANRYPGSTDYFLFFDHSIDLSMYAIRLQKNAVAPNPVAELCPQSDGSFRPAFQSFTDVIARYVNNPGELL
jgi:cell wall assembly regulator SMI1